MQARFIRACRAAPGRKCAGGRGGILLRDVYIINPKAGKKNTAVFFMERAKAFHAAHGGDYALCLTQREGHGEGARARGCGAGRPGAPVGRRRRRHAARGRARRRKLRKRGGRRLSVRQQRQRLCAHARRQGDFHEFRAAASRHGRADRHDPHRARRRGQHLLARLRREGPPTR